MNWNELILDWLKGGTVFFDRSLIASRHWCSARVIPHCWTWWPLWFGIGRPFSVPLTTSNSKWNWGWSRWAWSRPSASVSRRMSMKTRGTCRMATWKNSWMELSPTPPWTLRKNGKNWNRWVSRLSWLCWRWECCQCSCICYLDVIDSTSWKNCSFLRSRGIDTTWLILLFWRNSCSILDHITSVLMGNRLQFQKSYPDIYAARFNNSTSEESIFAACAVEKPKARLTKFKSLRM
jgi:hypothetical protein